MPRGTASNKPIRLELTDDYSAKVRKLVAIAPGVTETEVREHLVSRIEEDEVERWITERSVAHQVAAGLHVKADLPAIELPDPGLVEFKAEK